MGFMAFELLTHNLGSRPRANTMGEWGGGRSGGGRPEVWGAVLFGRG